MEQDNTYLTDEDLKEMYFNTQPKQKITINSRLQKAKEEPVMTKYFGNYLFSGEIAILAGDTGAGKSTLAFQIADNVSKGVGTLNQINENTEQDVIIYDFEMSNRSLFKRYRDHTFSDKLLCPDIEEIFMENDGAFDMDIIEKHIITYDPKLVIIDNLSAIALKSTQDQDVSLQLMKDFKYLSKAFDITLLILHHTPKIACNVPLTLNHIAGSKNLTNFADSVMILGKSSQSLNMRYLKQLKCRNDELTPDVIAMEIIYDKFLQFDYLGLDIEEKHIEIDQDKNERQRNKYKEIACEFFHNQAWRFTDFCNHYAKAKTQSVENGKKIHNKLRMFNFITKNPEGKWILNGNEIPAVG